MKLVFLTSISDFRTVVGYFRTQVGLFVSFSMVFLAFFRNYKKYDISKKCDVIKEKSQTRICI